MTTAQLKEHAARLREFADPECADDEDVEALEALATFLDSLREETDEVFAGHECPNPGDPSQIRDVFVRQTRFVSDWTEQPTTEEESNG